MHLPGPSYSQTDIYTSRIVPMGKSHGSHLNSRIESGDWGLHLISAKARLRRLSAAGQDWSRTINIHRPLCQFVVKNRSTFGASTHFCGVSISIMAAVRLKACRDANPSENEELGNTQDAPVRGLHWFSHIALWNWSTMVSGNCPWEKRLPQHPVQRACCRTLK